MSEPTAKAIFALVEAQRRQLLNAIGVAQCIRVAADASDRPSELAGAAEALEGLLQDVAEGLDPLTLDRQLSQEAQP